MDDLIESYDDDYSEENNPVSTNSVNVNDIQGPFVGEIGMEYNKNKNGSDHEESITQTHNTEEEEEEEENHEPFPIGPHKTLITEAMKNRNEKQLEIEKNNSEERRKQTENEKNVKKNKVVDLTLGNEIEKNEREENEREENERKESELKRKRKIELDKQTKKQKDIEFNKKEGYDLTSESLDNQKVKQNDVLMQEYNKLLIEEQRNTANLANKEGTTMIV